MQQTVESLCNQLARNRLLEPEVIRTLRQRWRVEAKDAADDSARFSKWLIAGGHLTDFQFGMLTRGFADLLFLDEYKLLDRIGQGRMAGVYRAVHPSGQVVAVKVLPPSKAKHPQLLGRFQRESRLALRLEHPNVVRTFQVGKARGELHYMVMEYLDGETLEDVLERRKRLPPAEAVHILLQALRGLQHLDDEGLIHRDLKPANLMLVPPRAANQADTTLNQTVKILDIGLGRALFDEGTPGDVDVGDLTNEGTLLGTPNYMAPEQARNAHAADVRSDLYSLGCVFYEMLTGQTPFTDEKHLDQIRRHLQDTPRPLRAINPALPEEFQGVMDSLLAKDPAQRYATASQAARAVKALAPQLPEPRPLADPGPQMRTYLTWLETQRREDGDAPPAPPAPSAPPPAARAPVPAAAPPVRAPAPAPVPRPAPPAPVAAPVAVQTPNAPVARPVVPVAVVPTPATPAAAAVAPPRPMPPAATVPKPSAWKTLLRPTARELLFAGIGAGALLLLEAIVWLIVLIVS
jgi:serine/threonine protein kinase